MQGEQCFNKADVRGIQVSFSAEAQRMKSAPAQVTGAETHGRSAITGVVGR